MVAISPVGPLYNGEDRVSVIDVWEQVPLPQEIEVDGAEMWRWKRVWHNEGEQAPFLRFRCEIEHIGMASRTILPAVSYDCNAWGRGGEPKGLTQNGDSWMFAAHRLAIPGGAYSQNQDGALWSWSRSDCGAGLVPRAAGTLHRVEWPACEGPQVYVGRDCYEKGEEKWAKLEVGEVFEAEVFLLFCHPQSLSNAVQLGLDAAWYQEESRTREQFSPQELWDISLQFATEQLWVEKEEFTGTHIGLQREGDRFVPRPLLRYEIGWCGQNASFGVAWLQEFLRSGDGTALDKGRKLLDFWAHSATLPGGLFWTVYDHKISSQQGQEGVLGQGGWQKAPTLDACNLGWGAWNFWRAARLAPECGLNSELWRARAQEATATFAAHALADGTLPPLWSIQGRPLSSQEGQWPEATTGAFLLLPLLEGARQSGNETFLQAAIRAFDAYQERELATWRIGGGALDTVCLDKESAFPLLVAALDLYDLTGEARYLNAARNGATFLATWQWSHNVTLPSGSPLQELGYRTRGGTSVSTQHHHLDPWGALLAWPWLRLWKATGEPIWRDRAQSAWQQAALGVSDGTLTLEGAILPRGSQCEGFHHTDWGTHGNRRGGTSQWLVAWPAAFRLLTLGLWDTWADLQPQTQP